MIMQWVDGFLCRIPNPFVEYVSQFLGRATRKNAEMPSALSRLAWWLFEEIGPPRRASPLGQVCLLMNS